MLCHTGGLSQEPGRTHGEVVVTEIKYIKIDDEGLCRGLFFGFSCFEDVYNDLSDGPAFNNWDHMRGDGYCQKYGKFHCIGEDKCEEFS